MARMLPVRMVLPSPRAKSSALSPPLILVYAFGGLIALGTVLLMLPVTHRGGGFAPIEDALFTATSAATVTGLVTVETSTFWTLPGQLVILVLMFVGGLGIMTIASALLVLGGQRVSLKQRLLMRETIGTEAFANIANVTLWLLIWAVAIQVVGFVVLVVRFGSLYSPGDAMWHALFQAVSGFNNAGFTSLPASENLSAFQADQVVIGTIAVLVVLGSLGFWVTTDVLRQRRFSKLSLNSKLVLVGTGGLVLAGAAFFFVFEAGNDATIGRLSGVDGVMTSVFHSVNRTSGFTTVDFGATTDETNALYAILMLIGGASGSVAGGIKVNTAALIVIALVAYTRGKSDTTAFDRRIPAVQVQWAFALAFLLLGGVSAISFALTVIEPGFPFLDLMFEAASAFATVGLSAGITSELSAAAKILLVAAMFVGRVAPPMVIVVAFSRQNEGRPFRYATDNVLVG